MKGVEKKKTDASMNPFEGLPEMTKEPRFRVRVVANEHVAPDELLLTLERPQGFAFTPGQYLWLVIPRRTQQHGTVDRRAYHIASGTQHTNLELLIRMVGSDYLREVAALRSGDKAEIIGPMGSAFIAPKQGAVMIASSAGAAPFLSALRSGLAGAFSFTMFHAKNRPLYCRKELEELARQHAEYSVAFHEGVPKDGDVASFAKDKSTRPVFIAGLQDFVDEATSVLLHAGVAQSSMRYGVFYPLSGTARKLKELFETFRTQLNDEGGSLSETGQGLPQLDHVFFMAARQTTNHVVITDPHGMILYVNEAAESITGYTFKEMRGQTPRLWGGLMPPAFYEELWREKAGSEKPVYEVLNRRRDGRLYVARLHVAPIMADGHAIAYVGTEEDITDLRLLDKAKTEFVSLASHQLRTPLSAVNWYTEMLLAGDAGKITDAQRKYLDEIAHGSQRMVDLVNTLLHVSRIELGTFKIEPEPVDVAALVRSVIDEQKPQIDGKKLHVRQYFSAGIPDIQADPKLLRMVFQNLLSNAVKYTDDGGRIDVSISAEGKELHAAVADTGWGIPKDQQDKIFTKLFRADNVKGRVTDGTGLGLYIAKSIVDRSGGSMWFESEEGKGTTFHVVLPIAGAKKQAGE